MNCVKYFFTALVLCPFIGCGGGGGGGGENTAGLHLVDSLGRTDKGLVAFADGDSPFETVAASDDGIYRHEVENEQGRYTFMVYTGGEAEPGTGTIDVYSATLDEAAIITANSSRITEGSVKVTGDVSRTANDGAWSLSIGPQFVTSDSNAYSLAIEPGIYDIIASERSMRSGIVKIWVKRGVKIASNYEQDIDFDDPAHATSGETNEIVFPPGHPGSSALLITSRGSYTFTDIEASEGRWTYASLPSDFSDPGDVYCITGYGAAAEEQKCYSSGRDVSFDLSGIQPFPAPLYQDGKVSWQSYENASLYSFVAAWPGTPFYRLNVTPGYLAGANSYSFPELHDLDGWNAGWAVSQTAMHEGVDASVLIADTGLEALLEERATHRFSAGSTMRQVYSVQYVTAD